MADRINEILGTGGGGDWSDQPPIRPSRMRMQWKPEQQGQPVKIKMPGNPRFNLPRPAPGEMPTELGQNDIDALIARIRAEEKLPPHKKNAARITALKQQALDMMKQLESLWVQRNADRLLPRLEEG